MNGMQGIGNIQKFEFENTPLSESLKTDFKDSENKVFDLTLQLYCYVCSECPVERKKLPFM